MIFQGKIGARITNQQRGEEKKKRVLLWIARFDFSSIELLSALFRQHKDMTNLFFRRLIKDGYIVPFKAANLPRNDLVRIGFEGVAYLKEKFGIDVRRKMRSDEIARRKKLYHDYCLQLYIAETFLFGWHYSVLTEKSITRGARNKDRIPDALVFEHPNDHNTWHVSGTEEIPEEIETIRGDVGLFDEEGFWYNSDAPIAIEIEVTPKNRKQAWPVFKSLLRQVRAGKLKQVRFVFDDPKICNRYKVWFEELQFSHGIKLPLTSRYRDCFVFEVSDFELRWLLSYDDEDQADPRDWDLAHP